MIYVLVVGVFLLGFGGLNVVFAFTPAPAGIEPFLGAMGRRIRFVVSFFPEAKQEFMGRLLTGVSLLLAGSFALIAAVSRLFLS
jgi:hypothetical protein